MRFLVVIASYGLQNDQYLEQVLTEYRSMPYEIDIIVLSDLKKDLGPGVDVRVGLPTSNPWSLPFGHKQVFADRVAQYDFFIYTEDDILITRKNIEAFLDQSAVLPADQIPGFLRIEAGPDGSIQYCDVHAGFCWDTQSVQRHGNQIFAFFSNEHAACYILSRRHLEQCLASGRFLVPPHAGKYDLLVSAATDPYTQCGLKKMIGISDLAGASVAHLPNKYFERFGLPDLDMRMQLDALFKIEKDGGSYPPLIRMKCLLKGFRYLKDHFAPAIPEVLSLIPPGTRAVLSLGCGETEIALARMGIRVYSIPVDGVVSASAASKGVKLIFGDLSSAIERLRGQTFDCLLVVDVLHLVEMPVEALSSLTSLLSAGGVTIALVPDISGTRLLWGWLIRKESPRMLREAGINIVSARIAKRWFERAGMVVERSIYLCPKKLILRGKRLPKFLSGMLTREVLLFARRAVIQDRR